MEKLYSKEQLGKWWCQLNAKIYPKDFPLRHMSQEEAWGWISSMISWSDAKPYWLEFINKRRVK